MHGFGKLSLLDDELLMGSYVKNGQRREGLRRHTSTLQNLRISTLTDSFHSSFSCLVISGVFLILERVGARSKSFQIHHAQRQPGFMLSLLPCGNR